MPFSCFLPHSSFKPTNIQMIQKNSRGTGEGSISLSAFSYLYSELVQYHQGRVASISELERRLESSGYGVGFRVLELLALRSKEVGSMLL